MPRFKNTVSGVVVSVDAEAAMRLLVLGSWKPIDEEPTQAAKKTTPRKRTSSRRKVEPTPAETGDETDDE